MILGKKVVVVLPAYNAGKTLERTVAEIDRSIVDEIVLVDDNSPDNTMQVAANLGLRTIKHEKNLGYGGNQKTCYATALGLGADIVVMVHPDYQYTPKLIPAMAGILASDQFDIALGSRILGGGALKGGMPLYKYVSNRFLTLAENLMTGMKLSEYHTGYRAFTSKVLKTLPLHENDNDFIFDNQMLVQAHFAGFRIAEITCPTKYFDDASSINFRRSVRYGLLCLWNGFLYPLAKLKIYRAPIFRIGAVGEETETGDREHRR
jgi:glycosyltransferase involved in cell wall biosynthesis